MRVFKYVLACGAIFMALESAQLWANEDAIITTTGSGEKDGFGRCTGGCGADSACKC